jgi:hypothetical protein
MKAALVIQLSPQDYSLYEFPNNKIAQIFSHLRGSWNYFFPLEFQKQDNFQNCQNQILSVWLENKQ